MKVLHVRFNSVAEFRILHGVCATCSQKYRSYVNFTRLIVVILYYLYSSLSPYIFFVLSQSC